MRIFIELNKMFLFLGFFVIIYMYSIYTNSRESSRVTCKSCGKNYQKSKGRKSRMIKESDLRISNSISIQKYGSQMYLKLAQASPQLDDFDQYLLKRDRKNTKKIRNLTSEVQQLKERLQSCQKYIETVGNQNRAMKKSIQHLKTKTFRKMSNNLPMNKNDSQALRESRLLNEFEQDFYEEKGKIGRTKVQNKVNINYSEDSLDHNYNKPQNEIQKYLPSQQLKQSKNKKSYQISNKYSTSQNHSQNQSYQSNSKSKGNELLNMYCDGNQYQLITPYQRQKHLNGSSNPIEEFQFREQKTLKLTSITPNQFQRRIDRWSDQLDHLVLQESKAESQQTKKLLKNRIFQISQKMMQFQEQNLLFDETYQNQKNYY